MKIKKLMAFVLATGLLMSSMTVFAGNYADEENHSIEEENGKNVYTGTSEPKVSDYDDIDTLNEGDKWVNGDETKVWNGSEWTTPTEPTPENPSDDPVIPEGPSSEGGSSASSSASASGSAAAADVVEYAVGQPTVLTQADIIAIVTHAETLALQRAAKDAGFPNEAEMQRAAALNMSAGEYLNNAVVTTPGIANTIPVAQGGGIIINGVVTNATATITKVNASFVNSARASVEGTLLNVVDVSFPATEATINFYMPGVMADANIAAVQYTGGTWTDVEVVEVRADHVVLNLKQNGKVAFVAK